MALLFLLFICASDAVLTSRNGTLWEELKNFHEQLDEMSRSMFDLELELRNIQSEDHTLVDQAAKIAKGIRETLMGVSNKVFDLELLTNRLSKKEEEEEEEECGSWNLGMNLNPNDGHVMGYETGWSDDSWIGSLETALTEDYLNQTVWSMPANYIAIVRHHQGAVDAVKVFAFKHWGLSLSHRFKDMDPGRTIVTEGGPIQTYTAPGANNLGDDPAFSVGGDLAFNWGYGMNGARVVLTGGHLSDVDDDNTHGFGNNFWVQPKTLDKFSPAWAHEISNIQDCPYPSCTQVHGVKVQGTDHGTGSTLKGGPVYGNYAFYVTNDLTTYPTDGARIGVNVNVCRPNN